MSDENPNIHTWEHPRYPVGKDVIIDESIKQIHPDHALAGKRVKVCHGEADIYPAVPVAIPGETHVHKDRGYTVGNYGIIPEVYVR